MNQPPYLFSIAILAIFGTYSSAEDLWVVYSGGTGPGAGKHVVLIAGDEEYRSEEALPQLGKILSVRHGFKCTILFSITDGVIDPNNQTNIPGLKALETADMMIIATRFRNLPDKQMKYIDDFVQSGRPIMGLRTATHAFNIPADSGSNYRHYSFNHDDWKGGFGQQVLGDTWLNHHGHHGQEATRGIVNDQHKDHPVLNGVNDVFGPTDVYGVRGLKDAQVLLWGQVIAGMKPQDPPVEGKKNDPMMPLAWVREFTGSSGKTSRIFCTTMGASIDLQSDGLRRLLVNGVYWGVGLEGQVPDAANVDFVGQFKPRMFGFKDLDFFTKESVKPSIHKL